LRVTWKQEADKLIFNFELDKDGNTDEFRNPAGAHRMHKLAKKSFYVRIPKSIHFQSPHPDSIALAITILLGVFIGKRLAVQEGVSLEFKKVFEAVTGKTISPVNNKLKPRLTKSNFLPALAYSGGVDSTAAMSVMPDNTVLIFADRVDKKDQRYNKSAVYSAIDNLTKKERHVIKVETDIEYVINPITFAHPLAPSIPAILLSESLNLDTVAFGNLLENIYGVLDNKFVYPDKSVFTQYDKLFDVCGISAAHVTAGLTTFSTSLITNGAGTADIAQSCMYGEELGKPCMQCLKCLYKVLYSRIINNQPILDEEIDSLFSSWAVAKEFKSTPTRVQNAYMHLVSQIDSKHPVIKLLRKKLNTDTYTTGWMNGWYSDSKTLIPNQYESQIVNSIKEFVNPMSKNNREFLEQWDLSRERRSIRSHYWTWRLWREFGKRYNLYNIEIGYKSATTQVGTRTKVKVYWRKSIIFKEDITKKVSWGSSNSKVAYAKDGYVYAKAKGSTRIRANHGRASAEFLVRVI